MHLRIPPPIVALIGILLIFLSKDYILILYLHPYLQNTLSILFLVIGFVIILSATKEFKKSNTTVNPMKPETSTSLVTSGIFKYTRNPMYLGLSSILLASCFYFSSLLGIIVYVPFFILYITVFQIIPEEEVMKSLFNDEYLDYCSKVRRWI
jgi:protein-S-isoprenylcysteine O-methyltransferase Ste14